MVSLSLCLWTFSSIFISIFLVAYFFFTRKFDYWKKRNVEYVKPYPFVGSLLPVLQIKQVLAEWLRDLCREIKQPYFGLFVFSEPVLVVQCPKLVKNIMQRDFAYFQNRSAAAQDHNPIMKNFIFFSNNPKWKEVRSKLSPVFTTGKLKDMFQLLLKESDNMVEYINKRVNVPNVESKEICAKYGCNIIAKCAFAVNGECFEDENAEFRLLGRRIFNSSNATCFRQLINVLTPRFAQFLNLSVVEPYVIKRVSTIFLEVLSARMLSNSKSPDLVDIYVKARKNPAIASKFDDSVVGAEALQFFVAGFETVSSTLSFTLYELCIQPDIQEKLRNEVLDNINRYNGITYEGIAEMVYLDMCVSEALRKYPGVQFIDRECLADYKMEGSDLIIEKGTPIYIPLFGLHYDPDFFPDPFKYDPERFRHKNNINQDGLHYIPFGEGPRHCIGNRFGLLSVKIGIAAIISKFKLEATEKTPIPLEFAPKNFLLRSKVGIPLKFIPLE